MCCSVGGFVMARSIDRPLRLEDWLFFPESNPCVKDSTVGMRGSTNQRKGQ